MLSGSFSVDKKTAAIGVGAVALYGVIKFALFIRREGSFSNALTRFLFPNQKAITQISLTDEKSIQNLRAMTARLERKPKSKTAHYTFPARDKTGVVNVTVFSSQDGRKNEVDGERKASSRLPIVVWYHGGGMVLGSETDPTVPDAIVSKIDVVVVSIGYRLAPTHKFPAAVEDAYDGLIWAHKNANLFNGDPNDISLLGESAGGNLAAVVSILARDHDGPTILRQVLVYPWLDGSLQSNVLRHDLLLTPEICLWFRNAYIKSNADTENPLFTLLRTSNLSYLPKTLTIAAEIDPLVAEGELFHKALVEAGNSLARYSLYKNVPHGFYGVLPWYWSIDGSGRKAHREICDFLIS